MTIILEEHTGDFEPSLVFGQTYVTRRRATFIDAAALLSMMVALIALVPVRLIVPGMTDLGRPAWSSGCCCSAGGCWPG
jgi:polysaccharide biosynthesis protein PslJ